MASQDEVTTRGKKCARWLIWVIRLTVALLLALHMQIINMLDENTVYVYAASDASVVVTATPDIGLVAFAPTGFTLTRIDENTVRADWVVTGNTTNTLIQVHSEDYVTDYSVQQATYNGTAASCFIAWPVDNMEIYATAWGFSGTLYSTTYATAMTGGDNMVLIALVLLAAGLTVAMFITKSAMLGFPSAIGWAVLAGYIYPRSEGGDWEYLLFFGGIGMLIFSMYAAFGLRTKKQDAMDGDVYIDEDREPYRYIDEGNGRGRGDELDETKPSVRTRQLRDRAKKRRTGESRQEKVNWGEFR